MLTEKRTCDFPSCARDAIRYVVVTEGDRQGRAVDLCPVHSRSLEALLVHSASVDLPSKPRARMERTKLRTTRRTAQFKKVAKDGEKGQGSQPHEDD